MSQNKHFNSLLSGFLLLIGISMSILDAYIDIKVAVANATTDYEKNAMFWLAIILTAFGFISWVTTSALVHKPKYFAAAIAFIIASFLMAYKFSIWCSFYAGMASHYSKVEIENSLQYKAKQAVFKLIDNTNTTSAPAIDYSEIARLKNTITHEDFAVKNCRKLKGWKQVRDCQTAHGEKYEIANNQLAVLVDAQNAQTNDKAALLVKIKTAKELTNQDDKKVPLPAFESITDTHKEGINAQRFYMYFIATLSILVATFCGYFSRNLLDNVLDTKDSPALQSNTQTNNAQPQSFRQRYNAGEVSAWSGLFNRTESQPQTTAYAVNTVGDMPTAFTASNSNANPMHRRGNHEFNAYDDVTPNANAVITEEPEFIMDGVGFNAQRIPNPRYQRPAPIIVTAETAPRGVEIEFAEPEVAEISPALPDTNATLPDTPPTHLSRDGATQMSGGGDRGSDTDLAYLPLKAAILSGDYFKYFDFVSATSLRQAPKIIFGKDNGFGQVVATRYRDYAIADGLPMNKSEWVERFGGGEVA